MRIRYRIEVRSYLTKRGHFESDNGFVSIGHIKRVLRAEAIGNFNPMFCIYKGKKKLVYSDSGDLSDPFRREKEYLNSLFIET